MIKINLLPARKPKRQSDPVQKDLAVALLAVLVLGAVTFFAVHKPKQDKLEDLEQSNAEFADNLSRRRAKIKTLPQLREAVKVAEERSGSIEKLVGARAVPAHMLHELGELLTPGRLPTMTKEIAKKVSDPRDTDYRFREDWDPKHVWITSIVEKKGAFTIAGGAESDGDVTQLMKRMQASTYFEEVGSSVEKVSDKNTGVTYYAFKITGKVVY